MFERQVQEATEKSGTILCPKHCSGQDIREFMSDGVKGSDLERENAFLSASSLFMLVYALGR